MMQLIKNKINRGQHISVFYGTARVNLKGFIPMQETYKKNGVVMSTDCNITNASGVVFARMGVSQKEMIDYEVTDHEKINDLPILVAIQNVKLYRPLQIAGHHVGRPGSHYTGSPGYMILADDLAENLIKDSIKANPHLRDKLEQVFGKYISIGKDSLVIDYHKDESEYIPTREDVENILRGFSSEFNKDQDKIPIDNVLSIMEKSLKKAGHILAKDWRSITEKNIQMWSKEEKGKR